MDIGIIGAGNIGGALTRRFRAAGHDVDVANSRGPATLKDLASETGARAVSVEVIAHGKDVVVIAIPEARVADLPRGLFSASRPDLVVIDTGNYYPRERDGRIDGIESGLTESAWVEQQIGRPVVKVFNTIYAEHLQSAGKPTGTPKRIALAVAGDDATAKATVMKLVDEIGFDAVDAGTIADSWRQQPGSPGYCKDLDATGVRRALADATPERTQQFTATPNSPGTYDDPR